MGPCNRPRDQGGLRLNLKRNIPDTAWFFKGQGGAPGPTRGDTQSISFLIPAYTYFGGRRRGTGYVGGKIKDRYSWGLTLDRDALRLVFFLMGIMKRVLLVLIEKMG